jgi:hypothetical protein
MRYRIWIILLCLLTAIPAAAGPRYGELVPWDKITVPFRDSLEAVFRKPDVQVTLKNIRYDTTPDTLDILLDELDLAGALWRVYQCRPPYRIRRIHDTLFDVQDRSYLKGTLEVIYAAEGHKVFYNRGIIRSRFLGSKYLTVNGTALVVVQYVSVEEGVRGIVHVYAKIDQTLLGMAIHVLQPVLHGFIMEQTQRTLQQAKQIVSDVTHRPAVVRYKLQTQRPAGPMLTLFDQQFPGVADAIPTPLGPVQHTIPKQ